MCFEHSKKSNFWSFRRGFASGARKDFLSGMLVFVLVTLAPAGARAESSDRLENGSVPGVAAPRILKPNEVLLRTFRPERTADCFELQAPGRGWLGFEAVISPESAARPVVGLLEARDLPQDTEPKVHRDQSFLAVEASGGEVLTLCVAFLRPPRPGERYQVVSAFVEEEDPDEDEPVPDPFGSTEEEEDPDEDEPVPDPLRGTHSVRSAGNGREIDLS